MIVRTGCRIAPHLAPPNGQEEQVDCIGRHSVVISDCPIEPELRLLLPQPEKPEERTGKLLTNYQLEAAGA